MVSGCVDTAKVAHDKTDINTEVEETGKEGNWLFIGNFGLSCPIGIGGPYKMEVICGKVVHGI